MGPNENLMIICECALNELDVMTLYKAASVDIMDLKADLDQVEGVRIGSVKNKLNKKELLISMCHTEMTLMKAMVTEQKKKKLPAAVTKKKEQKRDPENLKDRIQQNI